jgi:Sulfotransferase domain/Sulfotransferase family
VTNGLLPPKGGELLAVEKDALRRAYFRNRYLRRPLNLLRYRGVRREDLFVASYPRSGTTWLRFLLFELLSGTAAEFVSVNDAIPYIGKHEGAPSLLPNGGRLIQTHEAFLQGVASAIYVVRDPRSVVLSEYRWQLRTGLSQESFHAFFEAFISGRANPYRRWDRHVATWLDPRSSDAAVHAVRFEDLRSNAVAELAKVARFLDLDADEDTIARVVENNGLEEMRAKEERAPTGALGANARPDIRFVNSGSTSGWRDQLSLDHIRRIEDEFREPMSMLGYEPLPRREAVRVVEARPRSAAATEEPGRVKVLYIAGWGRSGSTILDNLLGQLDGFFSTGELRYIWERGVIGDWICGCGRPVKTCEVWSVVLGRLAEDPSIPDAETILEWQRRVTRFRHTRKLLSLDAARVAEHSTLAAYEAVVRKLYAAVADVTGARVIVDSSKRPSDAAVLALAPGLEVYVAHLVRDPRAVAYSWQKRQPGIDRHGVAESTASWVAWNAATEELRARLDDRSTLVRYERFVQQPTETLRRLVELVGEDPALVQVPATNVFQVAGTHTVSGNPARFRSGSVAIRPDTEWQHGLRSWQRSLATAIALPLLRRYGYGAVAR